MLLSVCTFVLSAKHLEEKRKKGCWSEKITVSEQDQRLQNMHEREPMMAYKKKKKPQEGSPLQYTCVTMVPSPMLVAPKDP